MWACSRCGTEHEKLHDALECPCRNDPEVSRARRAQLIGVFCSMMARVALAPVLGAIAAMIEFFVGDLPGADRLGLGMAIGLIVGMFWAVAVGCTDLLNPAKSNPAAGGTP